MLIEITPDASGVISSGNDMNENHTRPNKIAAPNGGPGTQLGNSAVAKGPPSVS